ncbi:hypothetical protein KJ966_13035 [bacterium]|nr:hypothetical protein [bacterium]
MTKKKRQNYEVIHTTRTGEFFRKKDGVLRFSYFDSTEVFLEDALENIAAANRINGHDCQPLLIDITTVRYMKNDARKAFSMERNASAIALITSSYISRVIGNFFIGLEKTVVPSRLFNSEEDAIRWVKGLSNGKK